MNFIESNVIDITQEGGTINDIYKQIEIAGRTCYKSEDKMTDESAEKFVNMIKGYNHGAMLEHGTVYLTIPYDNMDIIDDYIDNPYSKVECSLNDENSQAYVTTNYRVIVENNRFEDLKFLSNPTQYHHKRLSFKFICDRGVSAEYNRHRKDSIAEQSTRYCNYSKNKFGNKLSIIVPEDIKEDTNKSSWDIDHTLSFWTGNDSSYDDTAFRNMCLDISRYNDNLFGIIDTWLFGNLASQWTYMRLIELGWKPQQARRVLPLDLKTELVHTAFVSDWKHFLSLRSPKYGAKGVHPDAAKLGDMIYDIMKDKGYII